MNRKKVVTKSPEETINLARKIIESLSNKNINIFISGDLGAGKTHFTKGLFQGLGVSETATSPTFELVSTYYGNSSWAVNHLDLYRLNILSFEDEVWLSEILEQEATNIVEWADKFDLENIKKKCIYIKIHKLENENEREIEISTY